MARFIYGIEELRKEDNNLIGKKCANLGELTRAGFRVPPGFALSVHAYARFMQETGLMERIDQYLADARLDRNDTADIAKYEQASEFIRQLVEGMDLPQDIDDGIRSFYERLCKATGVESVPVATRSAGPASHPGQYESYLYISGATDVVNHVRKVWSSTFNTRSLIARARGHAPLSFDPIGVAVLKMVNARAAGVMFTANPADGDRGVVYIESNWGLGESVVAGEATPDTFYVNKATGEVIQSTISPKSVWYVFDQKAGRVVPQPVPADKQAVTSLKDEHLHELVGLGLKVEQHFGVPQDIEWGVDLDIQFPDNVMLLQTRPIKNLKEKKDPTDRIIDLLTRGMAAERYL